MKIAYLIERLDPSRGGAETYSFDFTKKLAAEGHDLHVFTRADSVVPAGVTLHPVPVRGIGRAWRTLSFAHNVDRMLSRETFDVVHGIGRTWSQDVYQPHGGVSLASREARGPEPFWARWSPRRRAYRAVERMQFCKRPPLLYVALCERVRRDIRRFYDVPPEKIRVVYNGIDVDRFHPRNRARFREALRKQHGIAPDEVVFLIVAHNFQLKGVPEAARCVTQKDFPACRLLVVGKGRPFATAPGGRVIFAGAVDDTAPYFAAADAYVHPTRYDPCSLVVLEALAAGLPAITTTMNGAGELITNGREGFVILPRDATALDGAMRTFFDPARRAQMGAAARALMEKHTLDDNARAMIAVYEEILRLKGRS